MPEEDLSLQLKRYLRNSGINLDDSSDIPQEKMLKLLTYIEKSYREKKKEVSILDNALEISSREIQEYLHHIEEKQIELWRSNKRYRELYENSHDVLFILDPEKGEIVDLNNRVEAMLGYTVDELKGRSMIGLFTDESAELMSFFFDVMQNGQGRRDKLSCKTKSGEKRFADISAFLIEEGDKTLVVAAVRDITKRLEIEKALYDTQLLADNRKLSRKLIQSLEEERRFISHELHDELSQTLTVINTTASLISRHSEEKRTIGYAAGISKDVKSIFDGFRNILNKISPHWIDTFGLLIALEKLIERWSKSSEVESVFKCSGELDQLSDIVNIVIYRVVQEALTNVSKHANASQVEIKLSVTRRKEGEQTGNTVQLDIDDDGQGDVLEVTDNITGLGINGMRERVGALDGTCIFNTSPGKGMHISIMIPLNHENMKQS